MNFNNLCKFYILQYSRIRNHKLWRKFLLTEYDFYLLKRRRQKLGDVKFEIKQTYFDKYLISTNFEMVFSRQPGAHNGISCNVSWIFSPENEILRMY